jgi:hypothetical protein
MIVKKGSICALMLCLQVTSALSVPLKSQRVLDEESLKEVSLTTDQAEQILEGLETLIEQARHYDLQNRAPRPDAAQPCDGVFPACNVFDLTELAQCCCATRALLCCLGTSIIDILGACSDPSILLPSTVDKSDIDAICASTITLLKTILLELRGAFTVL